MIKIMILYKESFFNAKKLTAFLTFFLVFLFLTSCGWKFKVLSDQLPFSSIFISGVDNGVGKELLNRLRRVKNLNLVSSSIEANVTLNLTVTNEKIVVGFSGAGRPRELELRTSVKFEITDSEGKPIQPVDELKLVRSVNFSDTDVLAAQSHEAFHRTDIEKQLAIRIIERLQRVSLQYAN